MIRNRFINTTIGWHMKNRRITNMSMTALALLMSCIMASAQAAEILVDSSILDQAMDVIGVRNTELASAQEEINRLANSASSTFEELLTDKL